MTSDDVVPRILAAIEEAKTLARAATTAGDAWRVSYYDEERDMLLVSGDEAPHCDIAEVIGDNPQAYSGHIVRHDPASVLRRCAADRRRLERHTPAPPNGRFCQHDALVWPCPDFLDLADSYGVAPAS